MTFAPLYIKAARVISGSARGRTIGIPTLNIELSSAPEELERGIYACFITFGGKKFKGAMHYGQRPVFRDSDSLEVHVLDAVIDTAPRIVDIEIVSRIRDVQNFPDVETLKKAIATDIAATRAILGNA